MVREGIETVLFLTAAALSATPAETLVGGALGLAIAVVLGWLMFAAGRRLDVRAFFRVTSVLLILFAAGLLAHPRTAQIFGLPAVAEAALLWRAAGVWPEGVPISADPARVAAVLRPMLEVVA